MSGPKALVNDRAKGPCAWDQIAMNSNYDLSHIGLLVDNLFPFSFGQVFARQKTEEPIYSYKLSCHCSLTYPIVTISSWLAVTETEAISLGQEPRCVNLHAL